MGHPGWAGWRSVDLLKDGDYTTEFFWKKIKERATRIKWSLYLERSVAFGTFLIPSDLVFWFIIYASKSLRLPLPLCFVMNPLNFEPWLGGGKNDIPNRYKSKCFGSTSGNHPEVFRSPTQDQHDCYPPRVPFQCLGCSGQMIFLYPLGGLFLEALAVLYSCLVGCEGETFS